MWDFKTKTLIKCIIKATHRLKKYLKASDKN